MVAVLYAGVVEWLVGWRSLLEQAGASGPAPVLLVLIGVAGSYVMRALRIRAALAPAVRAPLNAIVRIFAVHNAANWLMPARTGEVSLPLQLRRHFDVPLARGTGVLLWLRAQDLHVLATLAGIGALGSGRADLRWLGAAMLAGGLCLPAIGYLLAPHLARRIPKIAQLLSATPRAPRAIALDLLLSWGAWSVKLLALGAALGMLLSVSPWMGLLGALGGDVAAVLPIHAPLGAGTYEAGVLFGLSALRPDFSNALSAAVQLHALLLFAALAGGAYGLTLRKSPAHAGAQETLK